MRDINEINNLYFMVMLSLLWLSNNSRSSKNSVPYHSPRGSPTRLHRLGHAFLLLAISRLSKTIGLFVCIALAHSYQTHVPTQFDTLVIHRKRSFRHNFRLLEINRKQTNYVLSSTSLRETNYHSHEITDNAFKTLTSRIVECLLLSDLKRKGGSDGGSTGWTSWVDDAAALRLQSCIDSLTLSPLPGQSSLEQRDQNLRWLTWMKASPEPHILDVSNQLHFKAIDNTHEIDMQLSEITKEEMIGRIGLRIIVLPSGTTLSRPLNAPSGALLFGKLLLGGIRRYRILPGREQRRVGEKEVLKTREEENVKGWLQYGGSERNYEALDIGPCIFMEIMILPKGLQLTTSNDDVNEMALTNVPINFDSMLHFATSNMSEEKQLSLNSESSVNPLVKLTGKERNDFLEVTFNQTVGGLRSQVGAIIRRVLDGRVIHFDKQLIASSSQSYFEVEELAAMGLNPVKGVLLYGPPGCGKTALARELTKVLSVREPKILAAPELLDRWVGGSEKLIRELFIDAENELNACGGDASKSSLHVIVIDEIDAVFRRRSSSDDSAQVARASAVNQILSKLDGVQVLQNVLLIGMTNRRELLDEALLRPGRLEVQCYIPLPDHNGRREILQIHFEALRRKGRLSRSLCRAIDGAVNDVELSTVSKGYRILILQQSLFQKIRRRILGKKSVIDLAAETKGFSGADLAGLVRNAGSISLARLRKQGQALDDLIITLDDVAQALDEIKKERVMKGYR